MKSYVARRVLGAIPLLLVAAFAVFILLHLAPGDPITILMPEDARPEDIQEARERLGLDEPLPVQFGAFLVGLVQFDLGESLRYSRPVGDLIVERIPATVELALTSAVVALAIGVTLGVLAAVKRGTWIDRVGSITGLIGISMPNFWLGLLLIIYVGGSTGWFPTGGRAPIGIPMDGPTRMLLLDSVLTGRFADIPTILQHLALPAITLGSSMAGIVMRMTRSSMVEVIGNDYVRTARAKGLRSDAITVRHVLRNALLPVSTVVGLEMASLLSGSIIVESIFAWPGLGELLVTAVSARDYALVQGIVVIFAVMFVVINLIVDLSYAVIDPRIRYD